ncbi:hypothetical protein Pan153_20840 [Gimesia panareensis]|uniref:DUF4064 domain-containing protein n=1 Tax=Gimesia panareensis TaxID=2527978 RepID=A0A518FM62_9PLAN|nr:hypothetical protein [Gimesia panareensis]QDV17432.1 hypothetical protein Pan153_20840 [Gimesia panareensis]
MQRSPETEKIEKHLNVISILFMVLAGFSLLTLLFLPLHFMMFESFMDHVPRQANGPDPKKMMQEIQPFVYVVYAMIGVFSLIIGAVMLATGINLRRRRHFTFCVIGSALICPSFPLGTALGVWSLLTLYNQHTRPLFAERTSLDDADFLD